MGHRPSDSSLSSIRICREKFQRDGKETSALHCHTLYLFDFSVWTLQLTLCRCQLLHRHNSIIAPPVSCFADMVGASGCVQGSGQINSSYYCLCSTCQSKKRCLRNARGNATPSNQGPLFALEPANMRGCQHTGNTFAGPATPPWTVWASCSRQLEVI